MQWLVPLGFMLLPIAALALMMFLTLTVAESDLVDGSGWALLAVGSMALLVAMPDGRQLLRLLVRPSEAAVAAYLGAHVSLASSGRALETVPGQAENRVLAAIGVLFALALGDVLLSRRGRPQ